MLDHKRAYSFLLAILACSATFAQDDSTDLTFYMNDPDLVTELDSMLYGDGTYDNLNLDFSITDTVSFNKVHVTLKETGTSSVIFKRTYTVADLESASLIRSWDVAIPLGILSNEIGYLVAIIVEEYDGSLGASITKTLNP